MYSIKNIEYLIAFYNELIKYSENQSFKFESMPVDLLRNRHSEAKFPEYGGYCGIIFWH